MKQHRTSDTTPTSEAAAFSGLTPDLAFLVFRMLRDNVSLDILLDLPDDATAFDPADAASAYAEAYATGRDRVARDTRKEVNVNDDTPVFKEVGIDAFSSDDGAVDPRFVKHVGAYLSSAVELIQVMQEAS